MKPPKGPYSCKTARSNRSHPCAHLARYAVVFKDLLRPAKAAAFPLHDEIPKSIGGGVDEMRSLRIASIGCRLAITYLAVKGVQRIQGIPQFPSKPADCRCLLLTELVFKDVQPCSHAHHTTPSVTWRLPGRQWTTKA